MNTFFLIFTIITLSMNFAQPQEVVTRTMECDPNRHEPPSRLACQSLLDNLDSNTPFRQCEQFPGQRGCIGCSVEIDEVTDKGKILTGQDIRNALQFYLDQSESDVLLQQCTPKDDGIVKDSLGYQYRISSTPTREPKKLKECSGPALKRRF